MMKQKGFTLTEVLCAIVIVSLALVAILRMSSFGTTTIADEGKRLIALNLLREKMETIKCESFSQITDETNTPHSLFPDYLFDVFVDDQKYLPLALKLVEVTVHWGQTGEQESLVTLIADR